MHVVTALSSDANGLPKNAGFILLTLTWVVVKTMVPLWVPSIIRHLIFRVPKMGP